MNQPPDHTEIVVNVFEAFVVADLTTNDASLQPSVRRHRVGHKGTLFMVADGMGGAAAGEIASQMAIEVVLKELRDNWVTSDVSTPDRFAICLRKAAQAANQMIHGYASSHQEYRGMGTTATIAGLLADTLYLAQIGDSRGYLVRDGVAKQITKDQSLMQKLIEAGELTEEEAAMSERRNIILQALGPEPNIKVDLTFQRLRRGDTLVLCSDGLSGQVSRDEIAQVVADEQDLIQACRRLIDKANQAGGPDNITVIISRFDGEGLNTEALEGDEVGHRTFATSDAVPSSTPQPLPAVARMEAVTAPMRPSRQASQAPASQAPAANTAGGAQPAAAEIDQAMVPTDPIIEAVDPDALTRSSDEARRDDYEDGGVAVEPQRRSRGMAIAIGLLALLIAVAVWYAIQTVQKVQPEPAPTTTPAPAAKSP
jgi:serine/threonine protein phosphatase PrpC